MCKTDMRGLAEHHSLKFIATEQAAIFNELGVRTGCNIVMFNNFMCEVLFSVTVFHDY